MNEVMMMDGTPFFKDEQSMRRSLIIKNNHEILEFVDYSNRYLRDCIELLENHKDLAQPIQEVIDAGIKLCDIMIANLNNYYSNNNNSQNTNKEN